jgi:serine/threonine protein kinase
VQLDGAGSKVQSVKCDHCKVPLYHSEFCKKLDKDHSKHCPAQVQGLQNQKFGQPGLGEKLVVLDKENRAPNNLSKSQGYLAFKDHLQKGVEKMQVDPLQESEEETLREHKVGKIGHGDIFKLANYEIFMKRVLGEGSYGKVVMGREILTNVEVAVKIVNKQFLKNNSQAVLLKREIYIQRKLHHQNILALKDVFEDEENIYLVLEFCSGGSLFDYIQKKKGLSEKETFVFFLQVCLAVETLHRNNIVHRDIKPENLLLDKAKNLKLCDFGCSFEFLKNTPKIRKTYCGTVDYMAPEFFRKQPHGMSADTWALGVLLFEMAHARPPFDCEDESSKIATIVDCESQDFTYRPGISEEFKDLVERILRSDPKDRLSFDEIFQHPWVMNFGLKLNIDIDRIRYKDNMFGDYDKKEVKEFFAKCELRPTEVVMFADTDYLDQLRSEHENAQVETSSGLLCGEDSEAEDSPSMAKLLPKADSKLLIESVEMLHLLNDKHNDMCSPDSDCVKVIINPQLQQKTSSQPIEVTSFQPAKPQLTASHDQPPSALLVKDRPVSNTVFSSPKPAASTEVLPAAVSLKSSDQMPLVARDTDKFKRPPRRDSMSNSFLSRKSGATKPEAVSEKPKKDLDVVLLESVVVSESAHIYTNREANTGHTATGAQPPLSKEVSTDFAFKPEPENSQNRVRSLTPSFSQRSGKERPSSFQRKDSGSIDQTGGIKPTRRNEVSQAESRPKSASRMVDY